jgi:hypothetical protein
MKVYAVSMDRNLLGIGFRRVVAAGKAAGFDMESIYFIDDVEQATHAGSWWTQKTGEGFGVNFLNDKEMLGPPTACMSCLFNIVDKINRFHIEPCSFPRSYNSPKTDSQ